jgi:hypothetical protein
LKKAISMTDFSEAETPDEWFDIAVAAQQRLGIPVVRIQSNDAGRFLKCAFPLCDEFYIPDPDKQEYCSQYCRNCAGHSENSPELFNRPTHLYRFFDKDGRLLYIGVSLHAVVRLVQHVKEAHWVNQACQVIWETFPNRYAALKAEKDAIRAERPPFNIAHNPGAQILQFDRPWNGSFKSYESIFDKKEAA